MLGLGKSLVAAACLLFAAQLSAETLRVHGVYPAGDDRAAALETIAIEPFGGVDGPMLSMRTEDVLRDAVVEGQPWFRVVPASLSTDADAALRGTVATRIDAEQSYDKTVEECVRRNEKRKCIEKRQVKVPCDRFVVRLSPSIRLIGRQGELIYTDNQDASRELRSCEDEPAPSADPLVEQAVQEIAGRLRHAFAPVERSEDIRILESRKGMPGSASKAFKDAVRLTKTDERAACTDFAGLEGAVGEHESVLFNIGLCAEAAGDLDTAESYYARAVAANSGSSYARSGLARLDERRRALMQLDRRYGE